MSISPAIFWSNGARLAVPAWTNNGVVSPADAGICARSGTIPKLVRGARQLMQLYAQLGCKPTWTCAPYQLPGGPKFGDHIAVGESNAVAYYNSVIGARTNKYGDYLDVACALIGLAPFAGLHTDEGRQAELHFDCTSLAEDWKRQDIFFHLLGHHRGPHGRPPHSGRSPACLETSASNLKALSAAVAASGGVELLHGVGVTPEAPTLHAVFRSARRLRVTTDDLTAAHQELSTGRDGPLDAVALGTPHFSLAEFEELVRLLDGRKVKARPSVHRHHAAASAKCSSSQGLARPIAGGGHRHARRYLHLLFAANSRASRAAS